MRIRPIIHFAVVFILSSPFPDVVEHQIEGISAQNFPSKRAPQIFLFHNHLVWKVRYSVTSSSNLTVKVVISIQWYRFNPE